MKSKIKASEGHPEISRCKIPVSIGTEDVRNKDHDTNRWVSPRAVARADTFGKIRMMQPFAVKFMINPAGVTVRARAIR